MTGPHRPVELDALMRRRGGATVLVADFDDLDAARDAYEQLHDAAEATRLTIEGVIVFRKLDHGAVEVQKATDRHTRRGLRWGIVGGIAIGVLFPPALVGSTVLLGAGGAGIGRLRQLHQQSEMAAELGRGVDVGHSGLIAVIVDPVEAEIQRALGGANKIVQRSIGPGVAEDIRSAAIDHMDAVDQG